METIAAKDRDLLKCLSRLTTSFEWGLRCRLAEGRKNRRWTRGHEDKDTLLLPPLVVAENYCI